MDSERKHDPGTGNQSRGIIRVLRGSGRNLWATPPGQRPGRLDRPAYEPPPAGAATPPDPLDRK